MAKKPPVVHCEFTPAGPPLTALLDDSFQLYLRRLLMTPEVPVPSPQADCDTSPELPQTGQVPLS